MPLPIDDALPEFLAALKAHGRAVLEAPPGAGKTTRVPLAMLEAGVFEGRLVLLEPRRLAARAAAERMAETLGEEVGGTVGYRIRGEARVSARTRIEVVTEGILTRMIQSDPELPGIGALLFDEFHERSLNADLGLALAWEVRGALRPDLQIVVMSATLDAGPVAAMLDDAPRITSEGRAFPVETRWRDTPPRPGARLEDEIAELTLRAVDETEGGLLVFLPGEGEIRRTAARLKDRLPDGIALRPLYGALPFAEQRAAIRPEGGARKLVLSTAIAETSLTIEDIRVVVDAGRARRARHDPGSGMSRLVTEPVSRAEADQRRGRAGRVAPGVCYRNWTKGGKGALPAFPPAEIKTADLAPLALDLALWGADDGLAFLTPPPEGALSEARALLQDLGALARDGAITAHGRTLAEMPLHPRLAHMLATGGKGAARLAALMSERDPLRGAGADLTLRLRALAGEVPEAHGPTLTRIRAEEKRLRRFESGPDRTAEEQAALAYPDRIGLRRPGEAPRSDRPGSSSPPTSTARGARPASGRPSRSRNRASARSSRTGSRRSISANGPAATGASWRGCRNASAPSRFPTATGRTRHRTASRRRFSTASAIWASARSAGPTPPAACAPASPFRASRTCPTRHFSPRSRTGPPPTSKGCAAPRTSPASTRPKA